MDRLGAAAVLLAACGMSVSAQTVDDVFPYLPGDGERMGPRGRLQIGVEGSDILDMRFKIELSRDGFDTIDYTFDQMARSKGWAFVASDAFSQKGALYFPQKPLEDGEYEWRTYAWNGVEWVRGKTVHRLTVDAVPPADVEGVEIRFDESRGVVSLEWDPVVTDRDGRPEHVAKYHVYRYYNASFFFVIRTFHIGETDQTHFEDTDPIAMRRSMVFYKITAEDVSGNEPERRF